MGAVLAPGIRTVASVLRVLGLANQKHLEVTFEEARRHLGVETQRQWSALAIARTTPVLLGLFSLVTLLAHQLAHDRRLCVRQAEVRQQLAELPSYSYRRACALVNRQRVAAGQARVPRHGDAQAAAAACAAAAALQPAAQRQSGRGGQQHALVLGRLRDPL